MKLIIKKLTISFLVLFSFFLLLTCVFKDLGRVFLSANYSKYYYGDLYGFSKLEIFKSNIVPVQNDKNSTTINDAKIITMGDSFFTANYGSKIFPDLLRDSLNVPLFNLERNEFGKYNDNPLEYLKAINYKKGDRKILVLESVERYSIERSTKYVSEPIKKEESYTSPKHIIKNSVDEIKKFITKDTIDYFISNSIFTEPIYALGKNFRFQTFNEIDSKIGDYSLNPKNLFYFEETNFANLKKDNSLIQQISKNIYDLKNTLDKEYNIQLCYILIPNKYSLYSETATKKSEYDNFIPRLISSINSMGVKAPDIYSIFKNELTVNPNKQLYYSSDTHYTNDAKTLAINATISELEK